MLNNFLSQSLKNISRVKGTRALNISFKTPVTIIHHTRLGSSQPLLKTVEHQDYFISKDNSSSTYHQLKKPIILSAKYSTFTIDNSIRNIKSHHPENEGVRIQKNSQSLEDRLPFEQNQSETIMQRDEQTNHALALLKQSSKLYAIAEIKHKPFYFTINDVIVAPRMKELELGDVIELDRVRELGSPDFVLQGNPYVHPSFFSIKLTVVEHPYSDLNVTVRKKKSGRSVKIHRSGHTKLRVSSISIL